MLKKIGINTFLYAIGPQIPRVFGFFMLPILTRYLTTSDYGLAGIIYSYVGLLGGIGDLGLHVRLANIYFKSPNRWLTPWRHLFGFLSLWAVLFAILQSVFLFFVLPDSMGSNKFLIILLLSVSTIFFSTTINICYRLFQYNEKASTVTLISSVVGVSTLVLNYVTIVTFRLGYLGWFISAFIASFIQFCFCAFHLFFKMRILPSFAFRKKYIKGTLRVTLPLIPHNYSSYILDSSDRFLLDRMKVSISEIGKYNFAYIFANYFDFFVSAVGLAISPSMYKIYFSKVENRLRQLRDLMIACQLSFFFLVFNAAIWLKEFLSFFIRNDELKLVYPLAIIILVSYTYKPVYWYVNALLTYNNKTQQLWKITFAAAVLNIILNIIFIPYYSIYATAASTFISFIFLSFFGAFLKQFKELNNIKLHLGIWFLSFFVVLAICLLVMDSSPLIKLLVNVGGDIVLVILILQYYKKIKLFLS